MNSGGIRKRAMALATAFAVFASAWAVLEAVSGSYISHQERQGKSIPLDFIAFAPIPAPPAVPQFALRTDHSHLPRASSPISENEKNAVAKIANEGIWRTNRKTDYINLRASHRGIETASSADGQVVYSARYDVDEHSRRSVPQPERPERVKSHLILSGCSFVFGVGLAAEDTLGAALQQKSSDFRVYNLGRPAGSIADAIATITSENNWDQIEPANGTVLVSFIADLHIRRFVGTMRKVANLDAGVYVDIDPSTGRYAPQGSFRQQKRFWTAVSGILARSSFLRLIRFDWPVIGEEEFRSYAKAIHDLRSYYREKFGAANRVIVFLNPGYPKSRGIIPFLEELRIPYLDYTDLKMRDYATAPIEIPRDGHPTREYNRILAELIHQDLTDPENQSRLENFDRQNLVGGF